MDITRSNDYEYTLRGVSQQVDKLLIEPAFRVQIKIVME